MLWVSILVVTLLVGYIISETIGTKIQEGFSVNRRTDIGPVSEGWTHDETGWIRDLRYTETFTNVQGLGIAGDFCRAVYKNKKPETLQIACALATRDGSNTLEYHSKTVGEGFRMNRDDYWKSVASVGQLTSSARTDYCRILQDERGEWFSSCAVVTPLGIGPREVRDTNPPPYIKSLLNAYQGCLTWYRWQDDSEDITKHSVIEVHGSPVFADLLKPIKTRGLQLNRSGTYSNDYLAWGEPETLMLDQDIPPKTIRAFSFWVWWDVFDKDARIFDLSNDGKDRVWFGVLTGPGQNAAPLAAQQAIEVRPEHYLVQQPLVEPMKEVSDVEATYYVFEIWDQDQRITQLRVQKAKENRWQHITITTTNTDSWWPTWTLWVDGKKEVEKEGRAIPALALKHNFIGKNFKGCIQDFRVYNRPMTEADIESAIQWSGPLLHPNP